MHGFSDASESGYAAVVYLRCQLSDNSIIVRQLMAKTRVAPLKRVTLPRLELCGAHLLAQLVAYCLSTLKNMKISAHYLWCDSAVALSSAVLLILQTAPPAAFCHQISLTMTSGGMAPLGYLCQLKHGLSPTLRWLTYPAQAN